MKSISKLLIGKPMNQKRWSIVALRVTSTLLLIFATFQVTLFSKLSELQIREIDDLAFEQSIWKMYGAIQKLDISTFFGITDYGYGWIYWIATSLIAAPGYITFVLTGNDFLVSVLPRLFSVACVAFTWFNVIRIVRLRQGKILTSEISGLLFLLVPSTLWYGMRFGTVSLITSLCIYSCYLILRARSEAKFLKVGVIVFGVAVGVKISALLFLPVFFFLLGVNQVTLKKPKTWMKLLLGWLSSFLIASHPPLIFGVIFPQIIVHWVGVLVTNVSNASSPALPLERFIQNSLAIFIDQPAYALILVFVLYSLFRLGLSAENGSRKAVVHLAIWTFVTLAALLAFAANSQNVLSYGSPYIPVAIICICLMSGLDFLFTRYLVVFLIIVLANSNISGFQATLAERGSEMNAGYYLAKRIIAVDQLKTTKKTFEILRSGGLGNIAHDFKAYPGVTNLEFPNLCTYVIFDTGKNSSPCVTNFRWLVLNTARLKDFELNEGFQNSEVGIVNLFGQQFIKYAAIDDVVIYRDADAK